MYTIHSVNSVTPVNKHIHMFYAYLQMCMNLIYKTVLFVKKCIHGDLKSIMAKYSDTEKIHVVSFGLSTYN